jgi:hypothetical protein
VKAIIRAGCVEDQHQDNVVCLENMMTLIVRIMVECARIYQATVTVTMNKVYVTARQLGSAAYPAIITTTQNVKRKAANAKMNLQIVVVIMKVVCVTDRHLENAAFQEMLIILIVKVKAGHVRIAQQGVTEDIMKVGYVMDHHL